ncbi:MAG TPA: hypothetical protein VK165_13295 [Azonexus sp.]|nr:hypothetical protein [Azonexus sp.]
MKIQDSSVHLSASHEERFERSTEATSMSSFRQVFTSLAQPADDDAGEARKRVRKLLQSLVDAILAALDGKKCKENFAAVDALPAPPAAAGRAREMTWTSHIVQTVRESERTQVCGKGCVQTADGRQIQFDYSLNLARAYQSKSSFDDTATIALKDPLMISFDGKSAELSASRISFDLDADGKAEEIPGFGQGSGFLVFDRNGNGKADDGRELFGVASGNGFADLAALDDDHNGWIDESDAAYKRLAVWSGDGFQSVGQRGVGALYTGAVDAPFSLRTNDNSLLGEIRAAGIYLTEAGEVGHLQQVDLAVSAPARQAEPDESQRLSA